MDNVRATGLSFGARLILALLNGEDRDLEIAADILAAVGQRRGTLQIARNIEAPAQRVAARAYGTAGHETNH